MTERHETDQRARDAFLAVQRLAGLGAWEVNLVTGEAWLSSVTMEIHGLESLEGFSVEDGIRHYAAEDQPVIRAAVEQAMTTGQRYDVEAGFFNRRGDRLWVRTLGEAEFDGEGKPSRIFGAFQDVTSRKQAQVLAEALRLVHEKEGAGDVQTLLEPLWEAVRRVRVPVSNLMFIPFAHSGAHDVGFWRSARCEWTPFLRAGDAKSSVAWREAENGPLPESRWADFAELLPEGEPWFEPYCVRSQGSMLWLSCEEGKSLNEFEKSAVVQLADALDRAQSRLLDRDRAHALDAQLRQSQRLDAIGRLAGGVAHDFNNLLMVIRGTCELRTITGQFSLDDFKVIDDAAARGQELTQQLLEFSKLHPVKPQVLDLNRSVDTIGKFIRRVVGDNVEVEILPHGAVEAPIVFARGQLDRLIMNLVVNARDAMPDGGRLTIETRELAIEDAGQFPIPLGPGNYFQLIVRDTGIGMDSDLRELIFEPFVSTKAVGEGVGLGLSMAHGAVSQFGGHIGVESKVGRGSTFTVTLPQADQPVPSRKSAARELTGRERGIGRILIVEDEPVVRRLSVEMLDELGFETLSASGLDDVRHLLTNLRRPLDAVICDVVMPGGNGPVVMRELRAKCGDVPVVFVSGHMSQHDQEELRKIENSAFLQKPFTGGELFHEVSCLLDQSRSRASGA